MDTTKGVVANRADAKKRTSGPPMALLKNAANRGSTSSEQESPPIVANPDSPLAGKKASGSGTLSRAPSIRMRPSGEGSPGQQGTPESRSKSPSPHSGESRERSESLQSESLMSAAPDGQAASSGGRAGANKRGVDSARKKILWAASKGEWGSLEQMLKILEQSVAGNRNSPDGLPLANVQDEVRSTAQFLPNLSSHFSSLIPTLDYSLCLVSTPSSEE